MNYFHQRLNISATMAEQFFKELATLLTQFGVICKFNI